MAQMHGCHSGSPGCPRGSPSGQSRFCVWRSKWKDSHEWHVRPRYAHPRVGADTCRWRETSGEGSLLALPDGHLRDCARSLWWILHWQSPTKWLLALQYRGLHLARSESTLQYQATTLAQCGLVILRWRYTNITMLRLSLYETVFL